MFRWLKPKNQPRRAAQPVAHNHWVEWRIETGGIGEVCDPKARLFVIEPTPSRVHAIEHARAHLDLGHHFHGGDFTERECVDADDLANLRLGIFTTQALDGLPAFDGPPTITGLVA